MATGVVKKQQPPFKLVIDTSCKGYESGDDVPVVHPDGRVST